MNIKLPYTIPNDIKNGLLNSITESLSPLTLYNFSSHTHEITSAKAINLNENNNQLTKKICDFSDFIFDSMGMTNRITEESLGIPLMIIEDGGVILKHRDSIHNETKFWNVRVNFLISKPNLGGDPIVEDVVYEIQEGEGWFLIASHWDHGCTPVKGNKPRVTLSMGNYVDPAQVKFFLINTGEVQ